MLNKVIKQLLIEVFGDKEGTRIYCAIDNYLSAKDLGIEQLANTEQYKDSDFTMKQLMDDAKERNDRLYKEYLNGNNDYRMLADKYGLTYDNIKKIIYRRNKKKNS